MQEFLTLPELTGSIDETTVIFKSLGINRFMINGLYAFEYETTPDGGEMELKNQDARFTFLYERDLLNNCTKF